MATSERSQATVAPEDCALGSLMKDVTRNKVGVVMGHAGGDRVQLRPVNGGLEWDAFELRCLTAREELSIRNSARNAATRMGL